MRIVQIAAIDMTHVKLLKKLNNQCIEAGMEVHCVSTRGDNVQEIKNQGAYFHHVPIDRSIHPINNTKSIMLMVKLFRMLKPDIVHVHTPVASVLGRIAAKIARVPMIIYTAHGFYFHEGMSSKQYKAYFSIEKYIGKLFTDYIFTQSKEDYKVAVENKFLSYKNKENYLHISNGIDLDDEFNYDLIDYNKIEKIKNNHNINKDDIVLTFIGRLVREKGILDLLNAYELIKSKNVKFIIIGDLPESERDNETVKQLERYKGNSNIIFTGQITNINEYLYLSDIYCLPSYREGMPRSIIEGMAMKNAIIATNIRGSREEVVDGENGYLINLNSSLEIAEKIDALVNNSELLDLFKENSYRRAIELYDENTIVSKQLEVFQNHIK
ncbi:glycosyltransferase family 4 protein [Mammaliicoccus sciuri]|uniref:glycosyltransferase family 4 protein n=1 Tax=Mammaliicoccus sciuri TaxID=1296 RepID=UPI00208F07B4|nr:glycosyltransferase family 4 protein [Mammaliicoccus sciuri]MCO4323962.1 glycosyltransferase family 4 protein [Mammaliicoccus sciuri]